MTEVERRNRSKDREEKRKKKHRRSNSSSWKSDEKWMEIGIYWKKGEFFSFL